MKNNETQNYWLSKDQLVITYSIEILDVLSLQKHTSDFLRTIGLPADCAPFLSFCENTRGKWNSISQLTGLDLGLDSSLSTFIRIGSDGNGNPIIIDTADNDSIKLVDHDNSFSVHTVNYSIEAFTASLVTYAKFINAVIDQNDNEAYYDTHFSDEQFASLKNTLTLVNNDLLSAFWQNELSMLLSNREQYQKESGD